jgi:hypothetical protein
MIIRCYLFIKRYQRTGDGPDFRNHLVMCACHHCLLLVRYSILLVVESRKRLIIIIWDVGFGDCPVDSWLPAMAGKIKMDCNGSTIIEDRPSWPTHW